LPYICVGLDNSVIVYYNMAPFIKFDLPPIKFSEEEQNIWNQLTSSPDTLATALDQLVGLRENGTSLSALSTELLAFENAEDQKLFVK